MTSNNIKIKHLKSQATLLGKEKTKAYLEDIWNNNHGAGLYFSAMRALGDELVISFLIKEGQRETWYYACHAIYDGRFALMELDQAETLGLELDTHLPIKRKQKIK